MGHNLKKAVGKKHVTVVFSVPNKLPCLVTRVSVAYIGTGVSQKYGVQDRTPFVDLISNVVCEIPFTGGRVYVGQTGEF